MHQLAALQASSRAARSISSSSATSRPDVPLVTFRRLPDVLEVATVVERRAADVCVLGAGCTAVLAAYSLAKAGKKVVLVPDYGCLPSPPASSRLHPLKLTDPDPLLVHLASESAAYWRGLELLAGAPLLSPHDTCDLVLNPDRDHPGAEGFNRLQEACTAAGVLTVPLTSSELNTRFRQLQVSADAVGLVQLDGAVLSAADTTAAAQTLADKAGVISRPGLLLRGWRDRGSCFQLRASSLLSPELLTEIESETLLLAPEHWHNTCLSLFGILIEGLQTREVLSCRVPAGVLQQQQQLPVWQSWGAFAASDAPHPPEGVCALPALQEHNTEGWLLQQLPAWGLVIKDPWAWQAAAQGWASQQQAALQGNQQQSLTLASSNSSSWVDLQLQQLHRTCQEHTRDVGPLSTVRPTSFVRSCTADGRPVIGQHPSFDSGRVIMVCAASGSQPYGPGSSSSSYQLSPLLAKLAADLVKCAGSAGDESTALQGLALNRAGLQTVVTEVADSWEQLSVLQRPTPLPAEEVERRQDELADKRQDMANVDTTRG